MQVSEIMSKNVRLADPKEPICDAALAMAEIDAGVLPVGEKDRLVGMITDRDIAVRAVALKKGPETPVQEVMTKEILYCFDDQDVDEVCKNMADIKVRRLPVVNREKRLVGILSLADIANADEDPAKPGAALSSITEPGGAHSQASEGRRTA
jgi:CBS domain-containing protein